MGFAAAVSVPDGVAIAADSRVSAGLGESDPVVMSDTQEKIVPLSQMVAAVLPDPYADASRGVLNLRRLLEQVRPDLPPNAMAEATLNELPGRLASRGGLTDDDCASIHLRLVAYSDEDRAVKVFLLEGLKETPKEMHSTLNPGLDWFGFVEIASRIVNGRSAFVADDVPDQAEGWAFDIPTPLMSLPDAIDLAETLVDTTATFAKYVRALRRPGDQQSHGIAIPVGGPTQTAIVTPTGFEWVRRPNPWTFTPPPSTRANP